MKRALRLLTVLDLLFIFLLSASGSVPGIGGDVVYFLAFGIPLFIGFAAAVRLRREREEIAGVSEAPFLRFGISRSGVLRLLPLIAPTVLLVYLIALLTSLLLGLLGYTGSTVADAPFWQMLVLHAVIPAVLEELLFRYLPIKLLYPYSPRACVFISALYFAFIHLDLFKMPYAFAAGVIFAVLDIACDSILPSLTVHLINNAASILLMKYGDLPSFTTYYFVVLGTLVAISLVFILIRRKDYVSAFRSALKNGESAEYKYVFFFAVIAVMCAILSLVSGG